MLQEYTDFYIASLLPGTLPLLLRKCFAWRNLCLKQICHIMSPSNQVISWLTYSAIMHCLSSLSCALSLLCFHLTSAQVSKYQPCPLLGPYLPKPIIDSTSPALRSALQKFTSYIDSYIKNGTGEFGPITPNTTSFSVGIFAGATYASENTSGAPYFDEYHHTASDMDDSQSQATNPRSIYAIGDLTQIFVVLMVLAEEGESVWSRSIAEFIPDLLHNSTAGSTYDATRDVNWNQVTMGDLAGHLAGIARTCK